MRLRRLMHSLASSLKCKRDNYKFEHERPTDEEIKEYLRKRKAAREPQTMEQKIAAAMAKLKEKADVKEGK